MNAKVLACFDRVHVSVRNDSRNSETASAVQSDEFHLSYPQMLFIKNHVTLFVSRLLVIFLRCKCQGQPNGEADE